MSGRALVSGVWMLLSAGAAGLCWAVAGPSEERQRELSRLPESNQAQLEASRKRNTLLMQIIKESAESEKNIALERDWNKLSNSGPDSKPSR
ncbi:ubiquinol-cytochrome-c reductase complex assembly factor 3 isoform X2 [Carcharodon carcharias]|uniref:ubiquinol-cytochrome-c reductase complex assembly factor 3 isoform X2 n=1 Tax=Carcharodon carcharias TaxID=13397 RepID=UPI001B7E8403|nr:ubiquinol-cytochrome-c reductase complex assembly factor 3 isoform X2 [Carcharodon carcharias]